MSEYTITYSAELMRNFLQDEILDAESKFEALQTQAGSSLLFSIGTDHALYLTREAPGTTSGWQRNDISSALIARDFGAGSGARCVNFSSAQCPQGAAPMIHLAMIVNAGSSDQLYLSLNNPDADESWTDDPAWTAYPFDAGDHALPKVKIVNVFLSEAIGKEYIVVDVLRDPASPQGLLYRYYIDPARTGDGRAWKPGSLAMDLSATGYTSCLGRQSGQQVDGLYTSGQVSGRAQINYQPLYNPYGGPANPSRFTLPGGVTADFIAASRNADNTSDLYLTAGDSLYCLPAKNPDGSAGQAGGSVAVQVAVSDMFRGVKALFAAPASASGKGVIVWGLNGSDQVFYTTCTSGKPTSGPWSVPLPIVRQAEQVSPYLDRVADANTFFCHTGTSKLSKAMKSPDTGMWTFHDITLDPPSTQSAARDVMSYTTRIQVTDANGQPVSGVPLSVTASNVTGAHINYLRYVLRPETPVQVETDDNGSITVVEPVGTLAGSRITVVAGATRLTVNPMDNAFTKVSSLTTKADLSNAQIVSPDGSTRKLVPDGTSDSDLQAVASTNQTLGQAYGGQVSGALMAHSEVAVASGGGLISEAGDLLRAVGSAIEDEALEAFEVIKDTATGVWQLIVHIGGQQFQAVLDTLESVVESAYHVLCMIIDEIKKVLEFLEFLFEWRDMTRTKEVLKTMIKVFLSYQVGQIRAVGAALDQQILDAEAQLASWAGKSDWAGLSTSTPAQEAASAAPQSAPGSVLSYHYQNNASDTTLRGPAPPGPPDQVPSDDAFAVLEREGDTLYAAIQRLLDLGGRITTMPLPDILTELVAILGEAVLESARNVLDAMFDLVAGIAQSALDLLDAPIHIPVVSDVLNFFGVPDFSFLDVICWIGAIPATLMYKIIAGAAPFPDTTETAALIGVPDYPSLLAMFGATPQVTAPHLAAPHVAAPHVAAPHATMAVPRTQAADLSPGDIAIHFTGHCVSGVCALIVTPLQIVEIVGLPETVYGKLTGPLSVIGGLGQITAWYVANKLVPYEAIENIGMSTFNDLLTCARLAFKLIGAAVQKWDPWPDDVPVRSVGPLKISDPRGLYAFIDMLIALVTVVPVIYHFVELSEPPGGSGLEIATIDELSNVTNIIARLAYGAGVNLPEEAMEGKVLWAMLFTVMNLSTGGMQIAEAGWALR